MKLTPAIVGTVALGLGFQANAVVYTANVTLTYGDVATYSAAPGTNDADGAYVSSFLCEAGYNGGGAPGPCFSGNFDGSGDKTWTSSGGNKLALTPATTSYFGQRNGPGTTESNDPVNGNNGTSFYNPWDQHVDGIENYTGVGQENCVAANTASPSFVSAYACVNTTTFRSFPTPVKAKAGGNGPAATATGTVTIDTVAGTMTGTLNVAAYMYRFADGAPFNGGAQDRISGTGSTLVLNLTGVFPPAGGGAWQITGGTAAFADTAFVCENAPFATTLCNASLVSGGHQNNGSHLSWTNVPVYDAQAPGGTLQWTIPGVVGSGSIDSAGSVTTSAGEFHRFVGMTTTCPSFIAYNPVQQLLTGTSGSYLANVTCGILNAGLWTLSGSVTTDWDGDGLANNLDNFSSIANNVATAGGGPQLDTNAEGYGNRCDPDITNDGVVNINDLNKMKNRLTFVPLDHEADLTLDGVININDINLLKSFLTRGHPGPSGLRPLCSPPGWVCAP